jgi:cytochrome P450
MIRPDPMPTTPPTDLIDDLLAPELVADPYPYLAELRRRDPVHYSEAHRGWLVTRYADVVAGLQDCKRLSSARIGPMLAKLPPERRAEVAGVMGLIQDFMIVQDPPEHTRLRRLVTRAFRPARVEAMTARIGELADEMLGRFAAEGRTEFVADFAYPFPATVIAELIGAPREDRQRFQTWSDELALVALGAGSSAHRDRHARAMAGLQQMLDYFDGLIERARRHPGDDMISGLLEGDGEGNTLGREEMKAMCALMLFGGHETTTNLLSSGLWTLSQAAGQLELLRGDPDQWAGKAVEEMLRFEPSVKLLIREVTEPLELGGRRLEVDDRVHLILSSANRDPDRFPDPDRVDISRSPNPHVAFGKGVHACIGAQLARIEGRAVFSRVFGHLPGLAVPDQEVEWEVSSGSRALKHLEVEYAA